MIRKKRCFRFFQLFCFLSRFWFDLFIWLNWFFLQLNRKSKFQVFTLAFWIKNTCFQLFSPWPKMISAYLIHNNRWSSWNCRDLMNLFNYQLITTQTLFPLENVLSLLTACVSSPRKDKKICKYFIVTVRTFFIYISCFTYRINDLNSSIWVRTEPCSSLRATELSAQIFDGTWEKKFFIQITPLHPKRKATFCLSHQYLIFVSKNRTIRLFSVMRRINNIAKIRCLRRKFFFSITYFEKNKNSSWKTLGTRRKC
jgi:hypothetical protein